MIQTINPYSEVYIPEYVKTNYDQQVRINEALLNKQQQKYDQAYNQLQGMKNASLNMVMLYEEGKEKLDSYNKEIANMFEGDLGDLAKPENQNKFLGVFKNVLGDTKLRAMHVKSNDILNEYDVINRAKNSKDPYKAGYAELNNWVFEREVRDQVSKEATLGMTDNDIMSSYTPKYTHYSDLNVAVSNMTKLLPENSYTTEEILREKRTVNGKEVEVPTDLIYHRSWAGVDREQVTNMMGMLEASDPRFKGQLEVEAKARYYQAKDAGQLDAVLQKEYENQTSQQIAYTKAKLKENEAALANLVVGPDSPQDQLQRKLDFQTAIELQKQQLKELQSAKTYDQFSESEKPGLNYELYKNNVFSLAAETYRREKVEQLLKPNNSAYIDIARQKLSLQQLQTSANIDYKRSLLAMKKAKQDGLELPTVSNLPTIDTAANRYDPIFKSEAPVSQDALPIVTKYQQGLYAGIVPLDVEGTSGQENANVLYYEAIGTPLTQSSTYQTLLGNNHYLLQAVKLFEESANSRGVSLKTGDQAANIKRVAEFAKAFQSGDFSTIGELASDEIKNLHEQYTMQKRTAEVLWNTMTDMYNTVEKDHRTVVSVPAPFKEEFKDQALSENKMSRSEFDALEQASKKPSVWAGYDPATKAKFEKAKNRIGELQKEVISVDQFKQPDGTWKMNDISYPSFRALKEDLDKNAREVGLYMSGNGPQTNWKFTEAQRKLIEEHGRALTKVNDEVGKRLTNLLGGLQIGMPHYAALSDTKPDQKAMKDRILNDVRLAWSEWAAQTGNRNIVFPDASTILDAGISSTGEIFVTFNESVVSKSSTGSGGYTPKYDNFAYQSTEAGFNEDAEAKTGSIEPNKTYYISNKRVKTLNDNMAVMQLTGNPFEFTSSKDGVRYRLTPKKDQSGIIVTRVDNGIIDPTTKATSYLKKGATIQSIYENLR